MATQIKQSESSIQKLIMDWLTYHPDAFVWRQNAGMRVSEYKGTRHVFRAASVSGISDIMGIWRGHPMALEVKRPGEKPTDNQKEFLRKFAKAGGIAAVVWSLEDVKTILGSFTYPINWEEKTAFLPPEKT